MSINRAALRPPSRRSTSSAPHDGSDYVFITGAPGSKWSLVARALSEANEVDNSDCDPAHTYPSRPDLAHFGNYFGPGMAYGSNFDRLTSLTQLDVRRELDRPFSSAGGRRLLKGHIFARNLVLLHEMFPRARFVMVYRNEEACFDWWMRAGGFSIQYPDYSWYGEIARMRREIETDCEAIRSFCRLHSLQLRRFRTVKGIAAALGLSFSGPTIVPREGESLTNEILIDRAMSAAKLAIL